MKFRDRNALTLAVFSHPNHEVAVHGLLQRLQPAVLFLTDGGGKERVEQSKRGLGMTGNSSVGLLDRATFLNHTEESFYKALLENDVAFFKNVVREVEEVAHRIQPEQILCDAVEFYNPIHDIAIPIVLGVPKITKNVFEVPLVYQRATIDGREEYVIQRCPEEYVREQVWIPLTDAEIELKLAVFDKTYGILQDVVMNGLRGAPKETATREIVVPVRWPLRIPEPSCVLRYDWRAKKLMAEGKVKSAITHYGHYLPMAGSLIAVS